MKPKEALREDVVAEREAFRQWMETVDARRLIVVDESGLCRGMRLLYGYAPRGERAVDRAPTGRGRRLSLIGWLDLSGAGAAVRLWGSVNGAIFRRFVEEELLAVLEPGMIVVWDNASIHRDPELEAMIQARGAELKRLPRYSPEFNPIELLWSKLKHYIRKARADTNEALLGALEQAAECITGEDAAGWFAHCGYCLQPT
jgi:transposase